MTLADLKPARNDPPWWPWVLYLFMAVIVIVGFGIYSRQSGHIGENRQTAKKINATAEEVKEVKDDLERLRQRADQLESGYFSNRKKIESIEHNGHDAGPGKGD